MKYDAIPNILQSDGMWIGFAIWQASNSDIKLYDMQRQKWETGLILDYQPGVFRLIPESMGFNVLSVNLRTVSMLINIFALALWRWVLL